MTVIKFILQGHEVDSLSWRVSDLIKNIMTGGERETDILAEDSPREMFLTYFNPRMTMMMT